VPAVERVELLGVVALLHQDVFEIAQKALVRAAPGGDIRVVSVDVVGRGESGWLKDPAGYQVPQYAADMLVLLAHLHAQCPMQTLDWVGTSMGGLIGLVVCGQPGLPLPLPVRRLVLNDVGPALQWQAIVRIGTYLGATGLFDSVQAAADALLAISNGFGPHTPIISTIGQRGGGVLRGCDVLRIPLNK